MLWVAESSCYTEHDRYGLFCLYAETVECMTSAGSVRYVGVSYVMKFYGC